MKKQNQAVYSAIFICICIAAVHFIIHTFTGMWYTADNPYNSYVLQAQRWLSGHLDLGQSYSHLEIAEYGGKYFISFPPFPSYVMLPFALIFGNNVPDGLIAAAVMMIGAVYLYRLFVHFKFKNESAVFWTLFTYIGTNMLFITTNAWVWFIAQNMCFTLSIVSLYYAVKDKGGLALAFWACSVGCRPLNVIYGALILYILIQNQRRQNQPVVCKRTLLWLIAPCVIAISYMALNYARFGSPIEFGHNYLPEFVEAEDGQFSFGYIRQNLPLLFKFPQVKDGVWQYPKFNGMAFYFVTPVFLVHIITVLRAVLEGRKADRVILWGIPVLIALNFLLLTMHRTMGGYQFGNRYTLDALAYAVFAIAATADKEDKYEKIYIPLMIIGFCVNLVGTIAVYNNWI